MTSAILPFSTVTEKILSSNRSRPATTFTAEWRAGARRPPGPTFPAPPLRSQSLPSPHLLRPTGLCPAVPYGPGKGASPICSAYLSLRAASRTPAVPPTAFGRCFADGFSLRHLGSSSATAHHAHRFPRGCRNEAAEFASCYGPERCSPFTGKGFYCQAFACGVTPFQTSTMTTRASDQFPRPDFHRQDTRPYGLRAKNVKSAKYGHGKATGCTSLNRYPASVVRRTWRLGYRCRSSCRGRERLPSRVLSAAPTSVPESSAATLFRRTTGSTGLSRTSATGR